MPYSFLNEPDPTPSPGARRHLPALLRRRAMHEALGHVLFGFLFFGVLIRIGPAYGVIGGGLAAAGVLVVVHWFLWRNLHGNHVPGSPGIMATLGAANRITLFRGLLVSLVAGFLFLPGEENPANAWLWWPGCLYLVAVVLDGVDGFWARRTGTQTLLGKTLDVNIDALGLLTACAVAANTGRLPVYYLTAGLAYYLLQLGLWCRRKAGKDIRPAPSRVFARLMAGIQMGFVGVALLPVIAAGVLELVAPILLIPFLLGFIWDGAIMGGYVSKASVGRLQAILARLAAKGPPVLSTAARTAFLRILILAAAAGLLFWAWRDVSLDAVRAAIGRWGWFQWSSFAILNGCILGAMCWRWSLILRRSGHAVGFGALVRYRMGANTLSYITPGPQFGGEPLQVHCLTRFHQVPAAAAAAAVAVDRLMELMGNLLFLAIGSSFVLAPLLSNPTAALPVTALLTGVVLVSSGLLWAVAAGRTPFSRLAAKGRRLIGRPEGAGGLVGFLQASEGQAAGILTDRFAGWYALGSLAQWALFLAEIWLIYTFVGWPLSASGLLTVAVASRLAFLLPLPGGLGALEASQILAVTSLGGDPAVAAAACCIMRGRDLVLISIGAGWALCWLRAPLARMPRRPLDTP